MRAPQPFPQPRLTLPAWLLTGRVTPTPAQLARLEDALSQRWEDGLMPYEPHE